MKLQLNEQFIDEKSNSMAHSQKIKDTQTELEKKITELNKDQEAAKKENR